MFDYSHDTSYLQADLRYTGTSDLQARATVIYALTLNIMARQVWNVPFLCAGQIFIPNVVCAMNRVIYNVVLHQHKVAFCAPIRAPSTNAVRWSCPAHTPFTRLVLCYFWDSSAWRLKTTNSHSFTFTMIMEWRQSRPSLQKHKQRHLQ